MRWLLGVDVGCLMPPCAMRGAYMPEPQGEFYAFAGFFYAVSGLGLVGWKESKVLAPSEIYQATEEFCSKDLQSAQRDSGLPMKYVKTYCFLGSYVFSSLSAMGFGREGNDATVRFARQLEQGHLGWPAGAMLYETQVMPLEVHASRGHTDGVRGLCNPPLPSQAQKTYVAAHVGLLVLMARQPYQ